MNVLSVSLLILTFLAVNAVGQESPQPQGGEVRFHFETGPPAWKGERILLPPGFAGDLGWDGVEEIRFAPGMFQPGEADFFSYVLAFVLEGGADVSEDGLKKELLIYYSGLSRAVMRGANLTVDTGGFVVEIEKSKEVNKGAPDSAGEAVAWNATLDWIEPFATKKRQTLYLEVHTWQHQGKPVVLSCVSPVDPKEENEVWNELRKIRKTFRLE